MTTFTTQGSTYGSYNGRYMYLTIAETVDKKNNKSSLTWTLYSTGGSSNYYTTGPTRVTINGTQVYYKARTSWSEAEFPAATGSVSGTIDVVHDSNGSKTIPVVFETVVYYSSSNVADYGGNVTLTPIDRTAPTVSAETTVISSTSFKIRGVATKNCDKWEYTLNGGSTWAQYSTTSGTSAETTLTGLSSGNYTNVKVRATRTDNGVSGTSPAVSADITMPLVFFSASNITANSVYINASSSVTCDIWEYSIDNGSNWVQFSTTAGASAYKTITGLTPNTTYQIKVRARKRSNGLYGTSAVTSVKTPGSTILNFVNMLIVDAATPSFNINWTVYDKNYTHTLEIKKGVTSILTISDLSGSAGTNNKTITLTTPQKASILNAMSTVKEFIATYVLKTYEGATQVGSASTISGMIQTTSENSSPLFSTISCADTNSDSTAVTENDQLYIQSKSALTITCTAATPRNGATIVKYRATVGEKNVESTTTTILFGSIPNSGSLGLVVSAIDSRGYETPVSADLTVIEYENITIDSFAIHRENNAGDTIQLSFSGILSPVEIEGTAKNAFMQATYRYKKTTDSGWSTSAAITGVVSDDDSFSFENNNWLTLSSSYAYDVQITVTDKLSANTVTLYINKGKPLVAFRAERIGINNNDPQSAVDVTGDIRMNGYRVMGFVSLLANTGTDLDSLTNNGMWLQETNAYADVSNLHYPVAKAGCLEVLSNSPEYVLQRYTAYDCTAIYLRYRQNSLWSVWKIITLS